MRGRAFAIVNPVAGGGETGRRWPRLAALLAHASFPVESVCTSAPGEATQLARRAVTDGHCLVVAVGGDGTVNEVVNGITGEDGTSLAALGVIPTGRGRDVCRNLAIPRDPDAAARVLSTGVDCAADLGVARLGARARFFVSAVGVGFDADVARRAQTRRGPGTIPYLLGVLGALAHHRPRPVHVSGDVTWAGAATAVVVANGAFYGGGMKIAPDADAADGVLDLVILGALGRAELLWRLPTVYRGTHVRHPKVVTARARAVTVAARDPLPVHVDGEPAGTTPVEVTVRPGALRIRR
ncbi:MAG: diacylglycerol kinase family lipid kinase [Candidatus Rokubacteria bacterium]|nr:diacylglycerol kinase family lipid kinase [Candidatus Rokubacteria bacterium]